MNTEEALRASLRAHADIGTTGDPWPRVDRAHRRSRTRRRAALAGALAVLVAGGAAAGLLPGQTHQTQPADDQQAYDRDGLRSSWLDDGLPRGDLGGDADLRTAAEATVRRAGGPAGGHVLYAGAHGNDILVLVRVVTKNNQGDLYWLVGADGPALRVLAVTDTVLGAPAVPYTDASGERRALGVVPRAASVSVGRVTIDAQGRVRRSWRAARNDDGLVDVPIGDALTKGPVVLRVRAGQQTAYSRPLGLSALQPDGVTPSPLQMPQVAAALQGAPGAGVDAATVGLRAVAQVLDRVGGTADAVQVKALYAGRVDDQEVVVLTVDVPGGGRVLQVTGTDWSYSTAQYAGGIGALGWRVVSDDGRHEFAGWFFDRNPDSGTTVRVGGKEKTSTTIAGLGLTEVTAEQDVTVRHGQAQLYLGPEARDAGGSPYAPVS